MTRSPPQGASGDEFSVFQTLIGAEEAGGQNETYVYRGSAPGVYCDGSTPFTLSLGVEVEYPRSIIRVVDFSAREGFPVTLVAESGATIDDLSSAPILPRTPMEFCYIADTDNWRVTLVY